MRPATELARWVRVTEADLTHSAIRELLQEQARERFGGPDIYVWVRDYTDEWVVIEVEAPTGLDLWRLGYTLDADARSVALAEGEPEKVVATTDYEKVTESIEHVPGRVLERKGTDDAGGRVFRVEILRYGVSRNGVDYTPDVIREAVGLYDGAKAFDHHRTPAELESSTIEGLVGQYRNVEAGPFALEGDLHLLPGASHVAEALTASLDSEAHGGPPLVGISHDVAADLVPKIVGGRRLREATRITNVFSADVVADPSAGGRATRLVAGGTKRDTTSTATSEEDTVTLKQLLELLRNADPTKRAELLKEHASVLTDAGFSESDVPTLLGEETSTETTETETGKAGDGEGEGGQEPTETREPVGAGARTTEATRVAGAQRYDRDGGLGSMLIREAVQGAKLDGGFTERVRAQLPEQFTDADLRRTVESLRDLAQAFERGDLRPTVPHVQVGAEDRDQKVERLVRTLEGGHSDGYSGIRAAYADISGATATDLIDGELPFRILREAYVGGRIEGARTRESVDTSTFGEILGDSIHRRMVAEYAMPSLQSWRQIVSSIVPRNDFRDTRITRMGGYGTLPGVNQGAPYQPLTTPGDEEVTYAISKRGGTEDLTLEAVANDDLGALQRIPRKLGRAAAQTVFRFVWDLLVTNPTIYDSVALFAAGHSNTDTGAALAQSTLSTGRRKMRQQAAYGDADDVLSIVPKFLVVPSALEETAFKLATSAVAITSNQDGTVPNIHQGLTPMVLDHLSDENDWYLVGDPSTVPTIEMGFYQGRQDPELFVQDDPRVGSMFNADKVTWKIRHIYSGAVLDYRGFYRGQG